MKLTHTLTAIAAASALVLGVYTYAAQTTKTSAVTTTTTAPATTTATTATAPAPTTAPTATATSAATTAPATPANSTATPLAAVTMNPEQRAEIETIVHDYILNNPKVILETVQNMQKAQYAEMQKKTQEAAFQNVKALFSQSGDPVIGNPKGKVTIVEFFDYQCPHCVDMEPVVVGLVKANPDLRVVLKEFPIRGPLSIFASKAALAANKQGKYWEFSQAVMKQAQGLTEAKIFDIAKTLGLNITKLKADMTGTEIDNQIKETYKLAQALQIMGTPALFVAKTELPNGATAEALEFIPGQVDQATLQASIDKAQKS